MKFLGKRSPPSISFLSSGSIKIFANGVAVYPTYELFVNILSISRMSLLILVGSSSSFPYLVFIEALSASSSIRSIGKLIFPFLNTFELLKYFFKLFKTLVFFLITATTGLSSFSSLNAIRCKAGASKSFNIFVIEKGLFTSFHIF